MQQSERGGRQGEGKEGMGQILQSLLGHKKALGFGPEQGGSPEGLWAEGSGHLARAHGHPVALRRGQTGGYGGCGQEATVVIQVGDDGAGTRWRWKEG